MIALVQRQTIVQETEISLCYYPPVSLSVLPSCFATIDHGVGLTLNLNMHYRRTTQTFSHQPHALQHTVIQFASITVGWQQTQTSSFTAFCMDALRYVKVLPGTEIMVVCGGGKLHCESAVVADRVNGFHNQLPTTCILWRIYIHKTRILKEVGRHVVRRLWVSEGIGKYCALFDGVSDLWEDRSALYLIRWIKMAPKLPKNG